MTVRDRHEDGRVPGGADAWGAPHFLAGQLVQGDKGTAFNAGIHDQEILVKQGRRGRAPAIDPFADTGLPKLIPVEIESKHARLAEEHVQSFAVAGWRARAIAVVGAFTRVLVLWKHGLKFLLPQDSATSAVEAEEMAFEVLHSADI